MSSVASANPSSGTAIAPGVLFRISAVASALAVGLVVVSAAFELGSTHWVTALVALPFLVANVLLARLAYPSSKSLTILALVSFLVAIALGGVVAWSDDATWAAALHVGAAAVALGVALVVVARALRGEAAPLASARDYLTLTKPRIMALELVSKLLVVPLSRRQRLLEDRRVGGNTDDCVLLDQPFQLAGIEHLAREGVDPHADSVLRQLVQPAACHASTLAVRGTNVEWHA